MRSSTTPAAVRLIGLAAVAVITLWGAVARAEPVSITAETSCGIFLLVGFLWLVVSGFFGFGSAGRGDWIGLVPFAAALVIREVFTLHSLEGLEVQFSTRFQLTSGPTGRHSVAYPLVQMFFAPILRDPQWFTMHLNGFLSALASLALYLFVRQRVGSRAAGFFCGLALATHPLLARFGPTDGPYSLLLFTWFSGLAMLSAPNLDARSIVGGAGLLGIAASLRMEGTLFLVASLLMLDVPVLLDSLRRHGRATAIAFLLGASMIAVQMYLFLPMYLGGPKVYLPAEATLDRVLGLLVWPIARLGWIFAGLFVAGVVSGIATRCRLGLLAFIAMLVVVAPVVNSIQATGLHHLIPTFALQATVAGMGAWSIAAWVARSPQWRWLAVAPAVAPLLVLVAHRDDLTVPYVFTEEYDMVRRHSGHYAQDADDCAIMIFKATGDEDIHNFDATVPCGVRVLDCRQLDCVGELSAGGCFYYLRTALSYFHEGGAPAACQAAMEPATRLQSCLVEAVASFERSVELEPIELRTIDIANTFPEWRRNYPTQADIGFFRVQRRAATGGS